MATVKSGLKRLCVPLGVILCVGIALSWYYFGWVASRREYFRKRDFRQLATLSGQIQQKIDNFDNIMDHSWELIKGRSPEKRAEYFTKADSDLEYQDQNQLPQDVRHMEPNDPPSLAIERDEGQYFLFFALDRSSEIERRVNSGGSRKPNAEKPGNTKQKGDQQNPSDPVLYTRSSVEKLISPLAVPLRSSFEAILVARRDGTVIFQQSSGNGVINIGGLEKAGGVGKIDVSTLDKAAMSTEVKLAGTNYTLYSQPIRLSYPSVPGKVEPPEAERAAQNPPPEGSKTQGTKPASNRIEGSEPTETGTVAEAGTKGVEEWIVCGLVQSDRFSRDSLAISSTAVLGFVVALLIIFFLSPFIKLSLLRCKERLHARDGVLLAISTFLGTALFTFVVLDAYYYGFQFHREMDAQLNSVAQSMQTNLNKEEEAIWKQLDEFDREENPALAKDLAAIQSAMRVTGQGGNPAEIEDGDEQCYKQHADGQDPYVCERTNILLWDKGPALALDYPYLNFVFWDDDKGKGMQRIKWAFQQQVTPFLTESDMPYFGDIEKEARWLKRDYPRAKDKENVRGIDSVYSVNSGKNIAIYWKLEEPDTKKLNERGASSGDSHLLLASLVTRPVSLIGQVLPADYQFAVVNNDGLVLFHSDPTKNRIENFFAECDDNDKLRSRVSERSSGSLSVYYAGRRQRLYVCPVQHQLNGALLTPKGDSTWSLAVFEDMLPAETMNSEALTTSSIVFVLYAGILFIAWALIHACWRGYPRKWFWPDQKKVAVYRLVALMNGLISAALLVCILRSAPGIVVLAGFLIPAFALALTFLLVNYKGGEWAGREAPGAEGRNVTGQKASAAGSLARACHHLLTFLNRSEHPRREASHAWAQVSLLIVVAVLPCFAFFRVSFEFERMLLINRGQHKLINSLRERQERVRSDYQSIALSDENENAVLDRSNNKDRRAEYKDALWLALGNPDGQSPTAARIGTTLASVDEQPPERAASEECFGEDLEWLLAAARPHYNAIAGQTETLISEKAGPELWDCSWASDRATRALVLTRHTTDLNGPLHVRSWWEPSPLGWGDWGGWFGLAAFIAVVFLFVRLGEKIFLLGLYPMTPVRPDEQEFSNVVAEFKRKVLAANEKARQEMAGFFHDECSPTPELRAIGKEFVDRLCDQTAITPEEIVFGVHDLADPYYRTLWGTLSRDERLALAQLAHEGLVNPKNHVLVAQLMKKGLIVRDPSFRLMNRSFTRFVFSALPPHTMRKWETAGVRLPWNTLRIVLLAAVASLGIFLYLTQQSLFESVAAYVAAIAAAIPALIKLVSLIQRAPAGGANAD
jgi:hypothetical protein